MKKKEFTQIHYNPKDPEDLSVSVVTEVRQKVENEQTDYEDDLGDMPEYLADNVKAMICMNEDELEVMSDSGSAQIDSELSEEELPQTDKEPLETESDKKTDRKQEEGSQEPVQEKEIPQENRGEFLAYDEQIENIFREVIRINYAVRRLEKKFESEILNSESRDNTVKTIYKELNEYKAGLIEKAMKNILYDFADLREMMLSQAKHLREKKNESTISLDEFESYADDIADLLEKYDVTIYKSEPGEENVAVRQKIARKVVTEDEAQVKKVVESLSFGYEYNGKVLYPEKISIYVKKK